LAQGLASVASAQDAQVRVRLSSQDPVWVGQGVILQVDLLAPGYFASAASLDLPDPEGILLMPPEGSPLVSTETIDGVQYTLQQHEVRVWPMRAGAQTIPAFTVRFAFKRNPLDTEAVPVTLTSDAVPLTVKQHPGTEGMGSVITARELEVTETWSPLPGAEPVKAGAAFTRTVTFTAPEVPGMVFPPFPAAAIDGLGIYTKRRLLDRNERGSLLGKRQDEITYVAKRSGQFTIPAAQYTWFDLDTQQLRTETLPARTLDVIANPQMTAADGAGNADTTEDSWFRRLLTLRYWASSWQHPALLGAGLLLLMTLLLPPTRRWLGRRLSKLITPLRAVHLQPLNPGD
jgi:hypothetical protein